MYPELERYKLKKDWLQAYGAHQPAAAQLPYGRQYLNHQARMAFPTSCPRQRILLKALPDELGRELSPRDSHLLPPRALAAPSHFYPRPRAQRHQQVHSDHRPLLEAMRAPQIQH